MPSATTFNAPVIYPGCIHIDEVTHESVEGNGGAGFSADPCCCTLEGHAPSPAEARARTGSRVVSVHIEPLSAAAKRRGEGQWQAQAAQKQRPKQLAGSVSSGLMGRTVRTRAANGPHCESSSAALPGLSSHLCARLRKSSTALDASGCQPRRRSRAGSSSWEIPGSELRDSRHAGTSQPQALREAPATCAASGAGGRGPWLSKRSNKRSANGCNGMQGVCPRRPVSCGGVAGRTAQPEAAMPESKLRARNGECRQLIMQVRVQQGCQARNNGFVMGGSKPCCGRGGQHADGILRPGRRTGEEKQPGRLGVPQARKSLQKRTMAVSEVGHMVANKGWSPEWHPQDEETLRSFGLRLVTSPDGGVSGEGLNTRGCNASFIPNPSFGSVEAETGMFPKKFFEPLVQGNPVGLAQQAYVVKVRDCTFALTKLVL